MTKLYESAGKDEKNAFDVHITEDMTPEDVAIKVLDILENQVQNLVFNYFLGQFIIAKYNVIFC